MDALFAQADVNRDGSLAFDEFAAFYAHLRGEKKKAGALAAPVPDEWRRNKTFKDGVFQAHCSAPKKLPNGKAVQVEHIRLTLS